MLERKKYILNGKERKSRCQTEIKCITSSGYLEECIFRDFWKFNDFEEVAEYVASYAKREYDAYVNIDDAWFIETSEANEWLYTEDGDLETINETISKGA